VDFPAPEELPVFRKQPGLKSGDTIVIWKLDRLGRSTIKLIELIEELKIKGVNLKSLQIIGSVNRRFVRILLIAFIAAFND
jgi:DNA invertase Pin-like site-specific DNA recombinase